MVNSTISVIFYVYTQDVVQEKMRLNTVKKINSILALTVTVGILCGNCINAQAVRSVNTVERELEKVQKEIDSLDSQLYGILSQMEDLSMEIENKTLEIEETEATLLEAQQACRDQYEAMKLRIQYMYEVPQETAFSAMISSTSFSEFLNRMEYVNSVYSYDKEKQDQLKNTILEIQDLKAALEEEKVELQQKGVELEDKQIALENLIDSKSGSMENLEEELQQAREIAAREAELKRQREEAARRAAEEAAKKAAEEAARKKAEEEARQQALANGEELPPSDTSESTTVETPTADLPSTPVVSSSSSGYNVNGDLNPAKKTGISGSEVVGYANQFLGNPYVWGGTSLTSGCDCSGFINQVFANFGIYFGSRLTSAGFRSVGQEVSYSNMQAGDIICYPGHVGIYTGNGTIVEAQSTKTGITNYRPATCHPIITIRRVL